MKDKQNLRTNLQLVIAIVAVTFIITGYLRGRPKPWPAEAIERCNLGYALSKAGREEEAIAYFSDAIRIAPKYEYPYRARGRIFCKQRRYDKALNDYNKAIELAPSADSFYWRALIHDSMQNYHAAIRDLEAAKRSNPSKNLQSELNYGFGIAHCRLKHWEEANHFLNLAISDNDHRWKDQRTANAYFWRGEMRREQKKYLLALSDYNRSIELDPKFALVYESRARIYATQNKWKKAADDFTTAIKIDPNFSRAYLARGWVYYQLGDAVKAEQDFSHLIRLNEYAKYAYEYRGHVRQSQHRELAAAADFAAAKQANYPEKVKMSASKWSELEKEMTKVRIRREQFLKEKSG